MVLIRPLTATDIETVTNIYAEVLEPSYISYSELGEGKADGFGKLSANASNIFREQLISLLNSPRHGFFVAVINNEITGFALASIHQTEAGHFECWLDDIAVGHKWQRRSIAKGLIIEVLEWGKKNNAKYFLLESGVQNDSAHYLFESFGFQPLSTVFWRDKA